MASKLPWWKFFPSAWRTDPDLRRCSLAARGVWIDMLCLMFESPRRGYLETNGSAWSRTEVATAIGGDTSAVLGAIDELLRKGVASVDEGTGAIYSRRMATDEIKRQKCIEAGSKGGRASTLKRFSSDCSSNGSSTPLTSNFCNSAQSSKPPPGGVGGVGEGGSVEPETLVDFAPPRARSNLPCDNVDLVPMARKLVEHYQRTVKTPHPRGNGVQAVIGLLNSGVGPGVLGKAVDEYAAECDRFGKARQHRLGPGSFFAEGGSWEEYRNGPRQPASNEPTMAEREAKVRRDRERLAARGGVIGELANGFARSHPGEAP